jgi:hypothetical protein
MNAKQKWLAACEVVDATLKAWKASLDLPGVEYAYSTAWADYRAACSAEYSAYQEFMASAEVSA